MLNSMKEWFVSRLSRSRLLLLAGLLLAFGALAIRVLLSPAPLPPAIQQPSVSLTSHLAATLSDTVRPSETRAPTALGTPVIERVIRQPGPLVQQESWSDLALSFDADRALGHIAELTQSEYAGRAVGSLGGRLAGDWIAERFAEYGLQPAGDAGTYFQTFAVPYADLTETPTLALVGDGGQVLTNYLFRQDYTIWMGAYADAGHVEGPVFWVSDGSHDDYDDIDVQNAIVLCRFKYPFDDVLRQALEHGANAVLLARPEGTNFRMRRTARENPLLPQGIPTMLVGARVLEGLLESTGLALSDLSIQYQSVALESRLRVDVRMEYASDAVGRNVLGVIPGWDPDGIEQVSILGAHYDHMGADPDGTIWPGANDDASGVAVLLEIAQQWQEQGYVPRRTVLFAVWDGEEIGLNGSRFYVEHPRYPLTSTVGMLQLDMVGAGTPPMRVGEGGRLASQSKLSASTIGLATDDEPLGGSDHVPFAQSGVQATLFAWSGEAPALIYHVPEDDLSNIDIDRLRGAGQLASLVMLNLSWEHEELEDQMSILETLVSERNVVALLDIDGPLGAPLRSEHGAWLAAISAGEASELAVSSGPALVAGDVATSTVNLRYRWADQTSAESASYPARWIRQDLDWFYGGPAWDTELGQHTVLMHLQQPERARSLVRQADELYEFLTEEAGLPMPPTVEIRFYGTGDSTADSITVGARGRRLLHGLKAAPPGYAQATGWPYDDGILLAAPSDLGVTLAQLGLESAGWSASAASWLSSGLVDHLQAGSKQASDELVGRYVPRLLEADRADSLWAPQDMPVQWLVDSGDQDTWKAQAWAMTESLLATVGPEALLGPTTAITDAWRSFRLAPWRIAAEGIQETLARREEAILALDQEAFMATVDPQNQVLQHEEANWFGDLDQYPAEHFAYESQLVDLDDDTAIVDLRVRYEVPYTEWKSLPVRYLARFVNRDGEWLYSDAVFHEQASEHFVLKYESEEYAAHSDRILAYAERAYAQVTSDLDAFPETPIEIKMYHQSDLFRFSIYMSMHFVTGWNEPGESIKLNIAGRDSLLAGPVGRVIAHELTHAALFAMGVEHGALHEGTSEYEAVRFDAETGYLNARKYRREVFDLVRSKRPITVEDLDDWRTLQPGDLDLFYSVGWDFVEYLRRRLGRETFLEWLRLLGRDLPFQSAFENATGLAFGHFDAEWRESVLRGHLDPEAIGLAFEFDGEQAWAAAETLSQPEWAGREAGTPGNESAAQYVASRFDACGLEPSGDEGTFLQYFPLERGELAATPLLTLIDREGQELTLEYRSDFREVLGGYAGSGDVTHEVIYVRHLHDQDLQLGGRVLLTQATANPWADARDAADLGAGALLLMTDKWEKHMLPKSMPREQVHSESIPVLELTQQAAESVLALDGHHPWEIDGFPDVLPLSISAHAGVHFSASIPSTAANVLGILRGSDPQLADEVILVSAHVDHVGSLPDGTVFPGANNDASGLGVLLETCSLWSEAGYRPKRSVVFAAWNANEYDLQGSKYFVAHPTVDLEQLRCAVQLDQVGAGKGYYMIVNADEMRDSYVLAHLENASARVEGRVTFEPFRTGNDHAAFVSLGVPSALVTWEEPPNAYTPDDSPENLDLLKLRSTGRVVALTLTSMAEE